MKILCYLVAVLVLILSSCNQHHQKINKTTNNSIQEITEEGLESQPVPTVDELMYNRNVLWIGVATTDYTPEYHSQTADEVTKKMMVAAGFEAPSHSKLLKLQLQDLETVNLGNNQLQYNLLHNLAQVECYKDASLIEQYTAAEKNERLISRDTFITYDPATFEEIVDMSIQKIQPSDIIAFRMKQLIYYDKQAATFKTIPLAIAPLFGKYESSGDFIKSEPIFWVKPAYLEKMLDLNTPVISYAKRTYHTIHQADIKSIKETQTLGELALMTIEDLKVNKERKYAGSTSNADGSERLDTNAIDDLDMLVDTSITFNSETYEEIIVETVTRDRLKDLDKIQLLQNWVWNEKTKQIGIHFVGFAPMLNLRSANYGANGTPLFYRRPDLDTPIKTTR